MKTSLASILLLAVQMAWATRILTPDAIEADIQERESAPLPSLTLPLPVH